MRGVTECSRPTWSTLGERTLVFTKHLLHQWNRSWARRCGTGMLAAPIRAPTTATHSDSVHTSRGEMGKCGVPKFHYVVYREIFISVLCLRVRCNEGDRAQNNRHKPRIQEWPRGWFNSRRRIFKIILEGTVTRPVPGQSLHLCRHEIILGVLLWYLSTKSGDCGL